MNGFRLTMSVNDSFYSILRVIPLPKQTNWIIKTSKNHTYKL